MSKSRQFYTQLLSISKSNLVETSYLALQELTSESIISIAKDINALTNLGVIESFINCKAYNKDDTRIFIGLACPNVIELLFGNSDSKKEWRK